MSSNYKTVLCSFYGSARGCKNGSTCSYAHGRFELRNYDGTLVHVRETKPKPVISTEWVAVATKKKTQKKSITKEKPQKKSRFCFEDTDTESEAELEPEPVKIPMKASWYDMMQEEFGDSWPLPISVMC